ncbi:hypothetical protein QN416_25520, partial [Glaciimonas sp. Cout2]|uniref:hypothetical protein n=1 Tax=Glaciimonas sp. Cout2 TaxID=3048621 RepID=UPI002B229512
YMTMKRVAIRLDPDKVKLHIPRAGIPIKRLLDGMTTKTVHRIKGGKNTTLVTAEKLAAALNVKIEVLITPVNAADMLFFLPYRWVYV